MLPWPIIDNNVINVVYGIASENNEAVVSACDNLGFLFDDFLKFHVVELAITITFELLMSLIGFQPPTIGSIRLQPA
jgi:hypothetical protein